MVSKYTVLVVTNEGLWPSKGTEKVGVGFGLYPLFPVSKKGNW